MVPKRSTTVIKNPTDRRDVLAQHIRNYLHLIPLAEHYEFPNKYLRTWLEAIELEEDE